MSKLTPEEAKSMLGAIKANLDTANLLLSRAIDKLRYLEAAKIEDDEHQRAAIVTGDIPVVKGADMEGYGGETIGKLDIHDSIMKGDDA